jgi:3D (Asp-Asp-Asp) domain-containing protein
MKPYEINHNEIYGKRNTIPKKWIIVPIIIATVGCLALIIGGGGRINISHGASIVLPKKDDSVCVEIKRGHFECSTERDREAAKKITTWYVNQETIAATITAYNSVPSQTSSHPCIAADGTNICALKTSGHNTCAGNYPFGTRIITPDLGECIIHDRTARKYYKRIDFYFGGAETIRTAQIYGKVQEEVEVIYP